MLIEVLIVKLDFTQNLKTTTEIPYRLIKKTIFAAILF